MVQSKCASEMSEQCMRIDLDVGRPGTVASVDESTGARLRRARTVIIQYNIEAYRIMRGSDVEKKTDRTIIAYLPLSL